MIPNLARAAIGLWALAIVPIIGLLMVGHTAAMPGPGDLAWLDQGLVAMVGRDDVVVHVIYADCSCADGLVRHLIERQAGEDRREVVLYVGPVKSRHLGLASAGFDVRAVDRDVVVAQLGVPAAPLLLVRSEDRLVYAGGYFQFPAAVRPLDVGLLAKLDARAEVEPLPVFGCAVSASLQARVDPLGLQAGPSL